MPCPGLRALPDEMPSLLLDEKTCVIRLPPDTLQNFWQVMMLGSTHLFWGMPHSSGVPLHIKQ